MARRRFAIRLPGMRKALTRNQMIWGAAGLLGLGALYYILKNQDTGIGFIDQPLEAIGDITGLEGRGSSFLPQIFGPSAPAVPVGAPAAEASGWGDWRFTNAYQTFENYDEMRFSNAYKNE
jgi:hypothetical protein